MIPNSIKLSSDKKSLQIAYDEEKFLILSSHLLRAYTPSAENKKNLDSPNIEKFSGVLIKKIEKVGSQITIFQQGFYIGNQQKHLKSM